MFPLFFSHIADNKNLEVINLSMCQGITVNGLMPICTNCTRFVYIVLSPLDQLLFVMVTTEIGC
jgi:hypothetical protein